MGQSLVVEIQWSPGKLYLHGFSQSLGLKNYHVHDPFGVGTESNSQEGVDAYGCGLTKRRIANQHALPF